MDNINPNFLLKNELPYELKICGINSEAVVQTLRKLFMSVLAEGLPIYMCNLYTLGVEEIFGRFASKIVEVQGMVTQQKLDLSSLTTRFSTKIAH